METKLFSQELIPVNPTDYGPAIVEAFKELRRLLGTDIPAYAWKENYIAASFRVKVDKPSRGTVKGIDIRDEEPILLLFHKKFYPNQCPDIKLDRKDFPSTQLPHLYPALEGEPSGMCIHRGNKNDWFAEHTLGDLIKRIRSWLRDAARNRLIPEGDFFEATRIEGYTGVVVYDPYTIYRAIEEQWSENDGNAGFAFLYMRIPGKKQDFFETKDARYAVEFHFVLNKNVLTQARDLFIEFNDLMEKVDCKDKYLIGILVFPARDLAYEEYIALRPQTFKDIRLIGEAFGLPINAALSSYLAHDLQLLKGIPLILAVQRPVELIGTNSRIELLHFLLEAFGEFTPDDRGWKDNMPVQILAHRKPLTIRLAQEISTASINPSNRLALIGCGATGSKIAMHLARAGNTNLLVVDTDELSPHNFVRHALLYESVGKNKAEAIKEVVEDIYKFDKGNLNIEALKISASELLSGDFREKIAVCRTIIDCTASASAQHLFVGTKEMISPIIRCEITDKGRLGLAYFEGHDRNPRLDDLQATIFDAAIEKKVISDWLMGFRDERQRRVGPALEDIEIGLSCSSATMRLADDIVSYHSALFNMNIRKHLTSENQRGKISVSYRNDMEDITFGFTLDVAPVIAIKSGGNIRDWEIRISDKAAQFMRRKCIECSPNETGGILVGYLHRKRKIVYVTRALEPPPDSVGSPYAFLRGITDMPEIIEDIGQKTGELLGYVGEWHSHPKGMHWPSHVDMDAVSSMKKVLNKVNIPTHILIVTPQGFHPYLF